MERITPPRKVKVAHAVSGIGLIVGGVIFAIVQLSALKTLLDWPESSGYSTRPTRRRAMSGAWLAQVGIIALISLCTKDRCCYILDIISSIFCLVGMGLYFLLTLFLWDDVIDLGRDEGCDLEPNCGTFYILIVAALVVEFITYLVFVPLNLYTAIVAKRHVTVMIPHTAGLQVIQIHNGYTVSNSPPSYDHLLSTIRFRDFKPFDGGYVDLADKKKLTSSYI